METLPPPCVMFEDDHLLVVDKPAGVNTHAPAPFAGEGIYEWLRHREPRWAALAIVHRLDKDTSGVMVFAKTPLANRSLTEQFTRRAVAKKYLFITDRSPAKSQWQVVSTIERVGDKYFSRPVKAGANKAETHFQVQETGARALVEARPLTGRTHQIRVHAAASGCPILGDVLYEGTPAKRLFLHAAELRFRHPASGKALCFAALPKFAAPASRQRRTAVIHPQETDAYRLVQGAADGQAGIYADKLGGYVLVQSEREPAAGFAGAKGIYHKLWRRTVRDARPEAAAPRLIAGEAAPETFTVRENGVAFELGFSEGYSVGLFLDQRDNRRRFLTGHVAADFPLYVNPAPREVLNVFAYTCGFSVCAALGGARATSLDLSKKYLEWGRRNFALNGLDPATHDFIYGEALGWLPRLVRKGRQFDAVVLDPPTFSQSKEHGVFRVERDLPALVEQAAALLKPGGVLLISSNAATLPPEKFTAMAREAAACGGRRVTREHYVPQPLDFPITREEPAYLKTLWLRLEKRP